MSAPTADEVLASVYDIANTADWQSNGKYPEQFGPFCGRIVNLIDQYWDRQSSAGFDSQETPQ